MKISLITDITGQEGSYLATNIKISVRKFSELAYSEIEIEWTGSGIEEKGTDRKNRFRILQTNWSRPAYRRHQSKDRNRMRTQMFRRADHQGDGGTRHKQFKMNEKTIITDVEVVHQTMELDIRSSRNFKFRVEKILIDEWKLQ